MNKKISFLAFLVLLISQHLFSQAITGIYTDFNYNGQGYWHGTASNSPGIPNNSHNLLAFTWNGTTYSTGVNDGVLPAIAGLQTASFQALPVASLPPLTSNTGTFIGVGTSYNMNTANNSLTYYLTDGVKGLDLGTGIYNLPSGSVSKYTVASVNPAALLSGPAIIITQIGSYSGTVHDEFYFTDESGTLIPGSLRKTVDFGSSFPRVGTASFKFWTVAINGTLNRSSGTDGTRTIAMAAFSLADFGISATNMTQIRQFHHRLSGVSDQAFIGAFNTSVIQVYQYVSGYVYANATATAGYDRATVKLFKDGSEVGSTVTNPAGYYTFGDLAPGTYTIRLTKPAGQNIFNASDGNTDTDITFTIGSTPVTNTYFTLTPIATPVTFGAVSAKIANSQLWVNWSTLSEDNNDHFNIEVSRDGNSFIPVGSVKTKAVNGNADEPIYYSFTVANGTVYNTLGILFFTVALGLLVMGLNTKRWIPALMVLFFLSSTSCSKNTTEDIDTETSVYIRIKQVDKDGVFKYSKVTKAETR
ncbi:SdrD B-like domain-containing protein [Niabella sp. CJ426]|uniref:SdrD B-like domain-containing protein n=1 Tax=Niabella sp. CJ426 TaxID=3393740 RepID=UPI003D01FFF5